MVGAPRVSMDGELEYPVEHEPEIGSGQAVEVAPGVFWLRMPLPKPLAFVNVWVLRDGDGWMIVDTAMKGPETEAAWAVAAVETMSGRKARRVLATHLHPDHCGMAGKLCEDHGAALWMTALEYMGARLEVADAPSPAPPQTVAFYRSAGWAEDTLAPLHLPQSRVLDMVHPLPPTHHRICDGDEIEVDGRRWQVIVGRGHTLEHACLYSPELDVFISGDQVLPKISSNVSVLPRNPDADPLEEWLSSLRRIKSLVPDSVLVLPAHKSPFRGLHRRIDELIAGHEEALDRLRTALVAPARAVDLFSLLFRASIHPGLMKVATGETLAHLNWLLHRGEIRRDCGDDGVIWWRRAAGV